MKLVRDEGLRFDRKSDGPPLYWSWTSPERPTAALLVLPGYGDHAWRYRHVVPRWAEAGVATLVVDFRGHGRSGGIRGFGRAVGEFMSDARIGREMLRCLAPNLPHFVFGHSHGGLVATHVALEDQNPWAGLVLSAPYFDLRFPVPTVKRLAGELAARIAPTFGIPSGMMGIDVVRCPQRAAEYDADPLGFEVVRTGWFIAARRAQARAGMPRRSHCPSTASSEPTIASRASRPRSPSSTPQRAATRLLMSVWTTGMCRSPT